MRNNFTIRKANIRDLKSILRLNLELFKKEYREFDRTISPNWIYKEGKKYFRSRIIKKDGFVDVVENKGKIIGYLCGGILKKSLSRKKAKYAKLESMIIEKKFRNQGLGTKLIRNFLNWCKKNKVNYVLLSVYTKNKLALKLYRKFKFKDHILTLKRKTTL